LYTVEKKKIGRAFPPAGNKRIPQGEIRNWEARNGLPKETGWDKED